MHSSDLCRLHSQPYEVFLSDTLNAVSLHAMTCPLSTRTLPAAASTGNAHAQISCQVMLRNLGSYRIAGLAKPFCV